MKKYLLILACACFTFAACDELMPDGNENENGTETPGLDQLPEVGGNENNKPTAELSPAQQQAKLQSVGESLLTEFPVEAFQNLADIADAFDETYGSENYDTSELEEWAENSDAVAYSHNHQDSYENNGVGFCKVNWLLLLSNHTGLFTFGASKVTVAPYEGTKAIFTVKGKTYEAEITSSGKVTQAYFEYTYHSEDYYISGIDMNGDGIIETETTVWDSETKVTLGVPESINVTFTENGTPLATVNAKFSLNVTPGEVQFSTDAFAVEYTAMLNGYELKVSKTGYDGPASKAQMMATISGNGKTLITYVASADLHLKTGIVNDNYDGEYNGWTSSSKEVVVEKFENLKVAMDILGEIQLVGTCSDVNKLNTEFRAFRDALHDYGPDGYKPRDEVAAAKHTENINNLLDIGVYYDKGSNKQADIKFEYYLEIYQDEWTSWESYGHYPIFVFNDGSQNKAEDFFTENAFSKLIESVGEFAEAYDTVFGHLIPEKEVILPEVILPEESFPDEEYEY